MDTRKLLWIFVTLCLLFEICRVDAQGEDDDEEDEEESEELEEGENRTTTPDPGPDPRNPYLYYAKKQRKLLKRVSADVMEHVIPHFTADIYELNITGDCTYGLLKFIFGLKKFMPWAIRMIDAAGKIPTGVLYGSLASLGNIEECTSVVAREIKYNGKSEEYFKGQYCGIDVKPYLPPKPPRYDPKVFLKNYTDEIPFMKAMFDEDISLAFFYFVSLRVGVCIPSSCSSNDLQIILDQVGNLVQLNLTTPFCEVKKPFTMTSSEVAALLFILIFFGLVIVGTSIDVAPRLQRNWKQQEKFKGHTYPLHSSAGMKCLMAFSVYANLNKLLTTKTGSSTLGCIHGIRVLTMAWIIMGHTLFYRNLLIASGLFEALHLARSVAFQFVLNVFPAVDSFVTISGILLMYTALQKLHERKGKFNFFVYYIQRYIRLTPAFLVVSMMMLLLPLVGSGPVWNETIRPYSDKCASNWWTNIFYFGSWMRREEMCLPHGWYLSCDMQYYLIAPLMFVMAYKKPRSSFLLLILLSVVSILISGAVIYVYELPPIPLFTNPDPDYFNEYMTLLGYKPYAHLSAFCIGMMTGYIIYNYKRLRINKFLCGGLWILSLVMSSLIIFGVQPWNAYHGPPLAVAVLYGATSRTVWSLCIAWVVLACSTGNGGVMNKILSYRVFVPLSRLTFLAYLIHPLLILAHTGFLRAPYYFTMFFCFYLYLGHLFVSYMLSFILTLVFESPFLVLNKLFVEYVGKSTEAHSVNGKPAYETQTSRTELTGPSSPVITTPEVETIHEGFPVTQNGGNGVARTCYL